MNLTSLSVKQIISQVAKKKIKAEEVVLSYLENIQEREERTLAFLLEKKIKFNNNRVNSSREEA